MKYVLTCHVLKWAIYLCRTMILINLKLQNKQSIIAKTWLVELFCPLIESVFTCLKMSQHLLKDDDTFTFLDLAAYDASCLS